MSFSKRVDDATEVLLNRLITKGYSDKLAALLWRRHPASAYFLARGGHAVPPPVFCNLALTNKCNLRCEICGSQKYLDETGVIRSHMPLDVFYSVAETLFPFMVEVELNSQGDPLLHPQIEAVLGTIGVYGCDVKVQTNGTLFTDRVIDVLLRQRGKVMLSLDAVGPRFDEVRRGGEWAKAEPQLVKFLRRRDRGRLRVGVYPTLTRRTVADALHVVQWSVNHGIEEVAFHRYSPIQNSFEEAPSQEELDATAGEIRDWLERKGNFIKVSLDGNPLNIGGVWMEKARTRLHWNLKRLLAIGQHRMMFPRSPDAYRADPLRICVSPNHYVEIGLDGQLSACCRAQDVVLGYATSVKDFADAWFSHNYASIRASLRRDASGLLPLPNCEGCIRFHAPGVYDHRRASHGTGVQVEAHETLVWPDHHAVKIELIQREAGHCHLAILPPGVGSEDYELWEDETLLGPNRVLHDDVREYGGGSYCIERRNLYFSTSDNSDARRNGRVYRLKKRRESPAPPPVAHREDEELRHEVPLKFIHREIGRCAIVGLPPGIGDEQYELWEDDIRLGPKASLHDDIRKHGHGRYSIWGSQLYFSASDDSDPKENGRAYRLKRSDEGGDRQVYAAHVGSEPERR
ncbi:MAG TPA: radical SAM protein [Nitrospira sp.]|nr:radical SAM protein [Nitrospira sp.]